MLRKVVYLLNPTSNHNSGSPKGIMMPVVYLLNPTSNHNVHPEGIPSARVVYLLNPTSNHNSGGHRGTAGMLYIFWILHQTTTNKWYDCQFCCCISFESYIKPQLVAELPRFSSVVYLLNPTSNHNIVRAVPNKESVVYLLNPTSNHNAEGGLSASYLLYIFWILHQTTTPERDRET